MLRNEPRCGSTPMTLPVNSTHYHAVLGFGGLAQDSQRMIFEVLIPGSAVRVDVLRTANGSTTLVL